MSARIEAARPRPLGARFTRAGPACRTRPSTSFTLFKRTREMTLFAPRAPQSSRKLLLLLLPMSLFILGPLFDSRAIGFDGSGPRIMIARGFIECRLGFSDRLFTLLALLGLGGELRPALGLVPLLLPLKIQCSLPGSLLTDFRRRPLSQLSAGAFRGRLGLHHRWADRNALRNVHSIPQDA